MTAATIAFSQHLCPPPCVSIPAIRFVKRDALLMNTPPEHPLTLALAYTEWELDVLCLDPTGSAPQHQAADAAPNPLDGLFRPSGPPKLKPGDVVEGKWLVADVRCETSSSVDTRTVGYKKIDVKCSGCGGECVVVQCPKDPLTAAENRWTVVPNSQGGKVFKIFDGQPSYHYKCVCLAD